MSVKGRQCESCNRGAGEDHVIQGTPVVMCAECWPSEFRQQRVLERALATETTR